MSDVSESSRPRIALELAAFVDRTGYAALPSGVIEHAKHVILDQLGCQLVGSQLPWNGIVADYAHKFGRAGRSTVIMTGDRLDAEAAALANGTFGHGFEIDDFHIGCFAHPGCVVVPTTLAIAEEHRLSGRDALLATALAAEVLLRVGRANGYSSVVDRGFHETSTQGPFGAASGAAKLLRLDVGRIVNALSIAGSHASGTLEYGQSGGDVKRLHAGMAAAAGIRSARLADAGLTGPPTVFEGRRGFLQAFADRSDAGAALDGLGESYHLLGIGFKAYCCMGLIHSQIDAVRELLDRHRLSAEQIEEIVIGTSRLGHSHGAAVGPAPADITAAQFSSHFSIGLTVAAGANDFGAYWQAQEDRFADPRVRDIARRVRVQVDDECEAAFPAHNMAKATIRIRDGHTFQCTVPEARGFPDNALTAVEIERKFLGLACVVLPRERAQRILETVLEFERLEDVSGLMRLLNDPRN